ncbi:MAG TPA: hypothetical protein PKM63_21320 [Panacibacter sp.]|nr:hypothetical protein [Panacibacter sp.]HNP46852.1 hypothetical protein [Panacibacter sp.]
MAKSFFTDKPTSDTNYFNLFLKYTALFIITWIASWLLLLFFIARKESENADNFVFDNGGLISIILAVAVIFFYIQNATKKYKYGTPFKMTFDDNVSEFTVRVVNTLNEKEKDITIPYAQLVIKELDKEDKLFGKQRLFSFYQQGSLMTRVNIDLTAWSRLENLEDLLLLLRKKYAQQSIGAMPADDRKDSVLSSIEELL